MEGYLKPFNSKTFNKDENEILELFNKINIYLKNMYDVDTYVCTILKYALNSSFLTEDRFLTIYKRTGEMVELLNDYVEKINNIKMVLSEEGDLLLKNKGLYVMAVDKAISDFKQTITSYKEKNLDYSKRPVIVRNKKDEYTLDTINGKIDLLSSIVNLLESTVNKALTFQYTTNDFINKINHKYKKYVKNIIKYRSANIKNKKRFMSIPIRNEYELVYIQLLEMFLLITNKNKLQDGCNSIKRIAANITNKMDMLESNSYYYYIVNNGYLDMLDTVNEGLNIIDKYKKDFECQSFEGFLLDTVEPVYTAFKVAMILMSDIYQLKLGVMINNDEYFPSPPDSYITWRYYIEKHTD